MYFLASFPFFIPQQSNISPLNQHDIFSDCQTNCQFLHVTLLQIYKLVIQFKNSHLQTNIQTSKVYASSRIPSWQNTLVLFAYPTLTSNIGIKKLKILHLFIIFSLFFLISMLLVQSSITLILTNKTKYKYFFASLN